MPNRKNNGPNRKRARRRARFLNMTDKQRRARYGPRGKPAPVKRTRIEPKVPNALGTCSVADYYRAHGSTLRPGASEQTD